ncbi:FAD-dependent urate hydroxylase [Rubripirellula lacrimiformis]|uniref:FAD-dependent urate hydroxylase n=1 Tax=Rubripirellula lacrimiformis TaxID=1930273 RepID=A0A517NLN1_9BACT|nr:FAD-dependent monooxygenase [Rubripirellula lacrimiformis]QDT08044.1 FAD-dependent urate hydroxylase [Rubripirellula lacrimiformis]
MDVAILGGGIAGLATAISLKQIGKTVRVYERRRSMHHLGAGIVCWPNATFVLSELGVLDRLRSVAGAVTAMRRISKTGDELGSLDIRQLDSAMGFPSLSVLRRDLMRILVGRADELGIPIHYGADAAMIDGVQDGNRVHFSDGTSTLADLVVGADGRMNSVARRYVVGNNQPVFQGFVNWIGVYQRDSAFQRLEICDYWGLGARFGIVPVSESTAYWAGGVAIADADGACDLDSIVQLRRAFDGWPVPVGEIVSQGSASDTRRLILYDHDPLPQWHKDNVLLVGDAAHAALPTSGQGAGQALEDAWVLGRELAAFPGDHETAIAAFTQKRREKTAGITLAGRRLAGILFNTDETECADRDQKATRTDYAAMVAGMATGWGAGLPMGIEHRFG